MCRVVEGEESVGGVLLDRIVRIIYTEELKKGRRLHINRNMSCRRGRVLDY